MSNSIALTYRDKVFLNGLALNLTEMSEFKIGPWLSCCLWPASDKTDIELTSAELVLMRNDVSYPVADDEAATAFDRQDASIFSGSGRIDVLFTFHVLLLLCLNK